MLEQGETVDIYFLLFQVLRYNYKKRKICKILSQAIYYLLQMPKKKCLGVITLIILCKFLT